ELALGAGGEAARDPPSHDPPLRPVGLLGGVLHALREELPELLHPPVVERCAKTRAQAVSGELEKDPLVVGRAAPPLRAAQDDAPEFAIHRGGPALTLADRLLQAPPELLDFAGIHPLGPPAVGAL